MNHQFYTVISSLNYTSTGNLLLASSSRFSVSQISTNLGPLHRYTPLIHITFTSRIHKISSPALASVNRDIDICHATITPESYLILQYYTRSKIWISPSSPKLVLLANFLHTPMGTCFIKFFSLSISKLATTVWYPSCYAYILFSVHGSNYPLTTTFVQPFFPLKFSINYHNANSQNWEWTLNIRS